MNNIQIKKIISNDCTFCNEIQKGIKNEFFELYKNDLPNRLIRANDQFFILPSIGQIVEGYLLILPINHMISLRTMDNCNIVNLEIIKDKIKQINYTLYNKGTIFFEHGMVNEQCGGCGIYHAHLHAVPLITDIDITNYIENIIPEINFHCVKNFNDIDEIVPKNMSYLYYENLNSEKYLTSCKTIPSQIFRKIIANHLNIETWKWQDFKYELKLIDTYNKFQEIFNLNII
jgi:diadenosine tetraphosphate (Ap4A) HIT family hydrolase